MTIFLHGSFDPRFAGEMVATAGGSFRRLGINATLQRLGNDKEVMRSTAAGARAFGVVSGQDFLLARASGSPVVAFAGSYLDSPVAFFALAKSGIRSPADFASKRIGYRAGDNSATIYDALMAGLGLPISQIQKVPVSHDLSEFLAGKIDIWPGQIGEESYRLKQGGLAYNTIRPLDYGMHVPGLVYFTSERLIKRDPALVGRFLRGVIDGWMSTYSDISKSVPLISQFDPGRLTPGFVKFKLEGQRDLLRSPGMRFGEFDSTRWTTLRDILERTRLVDDSLDMSRAVTFDFLKELYRTPISFGKTEGLKFDSPD